MKCVFICDDDEGITDITKLVLEEKGYRVITLTDCTGIFKMIKKEKPDVILMDLWMPNISGDEVTKQLKENPKTKHIPVIIVSANQETQKISQLIGADDFLTKPFDIYELENVVERYTNQ